ncbi:GGDEF domain-containing protein [Actinoplanes bogorensis]|uniref:GGDEF domain-containing protein n=1 Tax=Paractinoplanes bogorensis TaxID=1610840 RepID=A0ABS5Z5N6_9ACTN|nr:GGDEF domain-containing protein [Actinoplanes bogorensis]MBU2670249.1 GGDEF domain-containing protein [Actinoplanes bogorensis]
MNRLKLPVVVVPALCGWYLSTTAGLRFQVLSCWLAVALFASGMSYHSFRAARRMERADPRRRFWTVLGLGAGIFAAGEWAQLAGAVVAPYSLASLTGTGVARTVALLLGSAVITLVVLTYPIPHRSARERLCYLLDLATVVVAAGSYGLYWTMGDGGLTQALAPVMAMLAAFAVARLFLAGVAPFRWHIGTIGPLAAGVEAVSRALGPQLVHAGRPGVIFAMTVCSHALLMFAAWEQRRSATVSRSPRARRPFSLLPYVALLATFVLLVVTLAVRGLDPRAWIAVAGVAAITGIVVARQLTAFVDNAALLRQRDALTERLHTMAFTDSLTGLGNRALFLDRVGAALRRDGDPVGVLLIDLDDFKPVNDSYGHAAGDAVLTQTAGRLLSAVRAEDLVARLGGDEFAVLIEDPLPGRLEEVADRIVRAVGEPCRLAGGDLVRVRASVGVASASRAGQDASVVLNAADEAMYEAKVSGKGAFRLAASPAALR